MSTVEEIFNNKGYIAARTYLLQQGCSLFTAEQIVNTLRLMAIISPKPFDNAEPICENQDRVLSE